MIALLESSIWRDKRALCFPSPPSPDDVSNSKLKTLRSFPNQSDVRNLKINQFGYSSVGLPLASYDCPFIIIKLMLQKSHLRPSSLLFPTFSRWCQLFKAQNAAFISKPHWCGEFKMNKYDNSLFWLSLVSYDWPCIINR